MGRNSDLQGKKYIFSILMESTGTAIKIYYCCSSAFILQGNVKMYQKNNSSGNLYQMKKHYHHTDFKLVRSQLLLSKLSKVISNGHQQLQLQPLHSCSCHFLTSMYVWHSYVESTKVQKCTEKTFWKDFWSSVCVKSWQSGLAVPQRQMKFLLQ